MVKKGFQRFPLNDLTGGINIRDFPSEIEDKQSIELRNWNFKGNKLVSSEGVDIIENPVETVPLMGMTKNDNDVYTIKEGSIYKNGDVDNKNNDYKIEWASNPDGQISAINVDGTHIAFAGFYNDEILYFNNYVNDIQTALGSGYEVRYEGNRIIGINKVDYTFSSISNSNNVKNIELTGWTEFSEIEITIDGTAVNVDAQTYPNATNALDYVFSQLPSGGIDYYKTSGGGSMQIIKKNGDAPVISSVDKTNYTYLYRSRSSSITNPSEINLGVGGSSSPVKTWKLRHVLDGNTYEYIYPTGQTWTSSSFTYNYTYLFGSVSVSNENIEESIMAELLHANLPVSYIRGTIVEYPTSGVDRRGMEFTLRKNDLTQITFSYENTWVKSDGSALDTPTLNMSTFLIETQHSATINVTTFAGISKTITNIGVQLGLQTLYNIVIGNIGKLITDRRGIDNVFIENDGTTHTLQTQQVGTPTVGTIYNGKTILGGYTDSDNIVFSKTAIPGQEEDIYDFSSYSAGGQSVSGGNKGTIKGFHVGENGLYVFKEDEVWYSNREKDDGTTFNLIFNKITSNGALNQEVITAVDEEIFYYDHKNRSVRRLGYEQNLTTLRDVSISKEIEDILKDLPLDQTYANSSFHYPNYKLSVRDNNANVLIDTYPGDTFREDNPLIGPKYANNLTLVYNVENKSWTIEDKVYNQGVNLLNTHSNKDVFSDHEGKVYMEGYENTLGEGSSLSKEYTFTTDGEYKLFGEIELIGMMLPDLGETKTFTLEVLVDGEAIELQNDNNPYKREVSFVGDGNRKRIVEKIELYDDGRKFQFKLSHSGKGYIEISDINIRWKRELANEYY